MATRNFVPRSGSEGQIGTITKPWGVVTADIGHFGTLSGSISSSISETGSFGHLYSAGNIYAAGEVSADSFVSRDGNNTISFQDDVAFGADDSITSILNITASNNISASGNLFISNNIDINGTSNLAGNVLMQNELNLLGNITASGNISASGNLSLTGNVDVDGISNFQGNVTLQNDLVIQTFNNLKVSNGRSIAHQLSMDVSDAWELDDDGNYTPATEEAFIVDPRFKVDGDGNIHMRKNYLWSDDILSYIES